MARTFTGANDKLVWTGGSVLYGQTAASVLCWFKHGSMVSNTTTNDFLFDVHGAFNKRVNILIGGLTSNGKLTAGWRTPTGNASVTSTNRWDDGLWHRLLFARRNSSPFVELYIDGVSDGSSVTNPTTDATASTGQWWANNVAAAGASPWSATDATAAIARGFVLPGITLTPQEADSILYTGRTVRRPDAWHEMGFGSPEPDVSGNGRSGTLTGSAVVANPPMSFPVVGPYWETQQRTFGPFPHYTSRTHAGGLIDLRAGFGA